MHDKPTPAPTAPSGHYWRDVNGVRHLPTPDDDGITTELLEHTPKRDADAANLRTLAAYTAVLVFVILLLISPALIIGTWKALV